MTLSISIKNVTLNIKTIGITALDTLMLSATKKITILSGIMLNVVVPASVLM
jgi:hypothetical protein